MPFYVWTCECGFSEQTFSHKPDGGTSPLHCSRRMERDWHGEARRHTPGNTFPFVTSNLSGKPIEVRDQGHLNDLCKLYGKEQRDDASFIGEDFLGVEWGKRNRETGKLEGGGPKYASGRGLPGQWV